MRRALAVLLLFVAVNAPAAITGKAVDPQGKPQGGARISLFERETADAMRARMMRGAERTPLATATAADDGTFTVDAKSHRAATIAADTPTRHSAFIDAIDGEDLGPVVLVPDRMRTGRVISEGKPVSNALVFSGGSSVRTKADGSFEVPYSGSGITVIHPDYAMGFAADGSGADITLDRGVRLSGRVVAADGKTAVPGARIMVDGFLRGESGQDGTFAIEHVARTWSWVTASANGMAVRSRHLDSAALTLRLARAVTLSGMVRTASGAAVPDAAVFAFAPGSTARTVLTDARGRFAFNELVPGQYSLHVVDPQYAMPQPMQFELQAGTATKNVTVLDMPRVSGVVMNGDGKPLAMARVSSETGLSGRFTDDQGRFILRIAPGREVIVTAQQRDYAPSSNLVKIAAGQTRSGLRFVLTPGFPFELRIVDRSGKPAAGEPVSLTSLLEDGTMRQRASVLCSDLDPAACRLTSSSGTFTTRLKDGTFDIMAGGLNFVRRRIQAQPITAKSSPMTIALDRGVEVSGRVTYRDGKPVEAGQYVVVVRDAMTSARVDDGGVFQLHNAPPGLIKLSANRVNAPFEAEPVTEVKAPATNVVLTVPRPARLEGNVVVRATKEPVKEFNVGVVRLPGPQPQLQHFAAEDGRFAIDEVSPVTGDVHVTAPGYANATLSKVAFEEGKTSTVTVQLDPGGTLTGRITADGKPVSAATIDVGDPRRMPFRSSNVMTDADGQYTIDGLAAGEYAITFRAASYVPLRKSIVIEGGKETRLDGELSHGLSVRGRVVDSSGQPVPGAHVRGQMASAAPYMAPQAESDAEGSFTLEGIAEGRLTVVASKTGYANTTVNDVDPSSPQQLTLTLQRGGTITGRISGLSDDLLGSVRIVAYGRGGSASDHSDSTGHFTVSGVPEGEVTVRGTLEGMRMRQSVPKTVTVTNGSAPSVEIDFAAGYTVSGHVTRGGAPVVGARVVFLSRGQNWTSDPTGTDGSYQTMVGMAGDYDVNVLSGTDSIPAKRTSVGADTTYDIDITGSTLRVHVSDGETNAPIPNAQVALVSVPAKTESGVRGGMVRSRSGVTDSDGQYVFDAVADGSYRVMAQKDQYSPDTQTAVVNGSSEASLTLRPADRLDLEVFDAVDHHPVDGSVQVRDSAGKGVQVSQPMRDGNGAMHVWLKPGQYNIRIGAPGYLGATMQATVPGPALQVSLQRGARLVVAPVAGAVSVRLVNPESGKPFSQTSMPPGIFDGLTPGTYRLEAVDAGGLVLKQQMVVLAGGQTTNITMP